MKIHDLAAPRIGDIVEFETRAGDLVEGVIVDEAEDGYVYEFSSSGLQALNEDASGYIPKNSREAQDPRWSAALTQDVTTHTMRDQLRAFYPTKAPAGRQTQVTEAAPTWARGAAGALGAAGGGLAGFVVGNLFGPIFGAIGGVAGAAKTAAAAVDGIDAAWDWAAEKLQGHEQEFAAAHVKAAAAGEDSFTAGGKTYPVILKPTEVKIAMRAIQQANESMAEAKYKGREVKLGKPIRGGNKKSYVYVRNPETGNVIKVSFGDPNMRIKKSNPARRRSFRARHKCSTAKDRTSARYWSCRAW